MGSNRNFNGYEKLSHHPNYKLSHPLPDESQIHYALRCASDLVSPPKELEESEEMECLDVSRQILDLESKLAMFYQKAQALKEKAKE